jgi:alanine dehydrogenase
MRIGVPTEIKSDERRVALTPAGAHELARAGHQIFVQSNAGRGSGFDDAAYAQAGAQLYETADQVWTVSELVLKVKEPISAEYQYLRSDLVLFTYLHLAADAELTSALIEAGTTAIAYETVEDPAGALPLLAPMSEIAGRLATQAGAFYLQAPNGGNGTLIGGAPGVAAANVLVLGGGAVGTHAARVAAGMGAQVTILERSLPRIRQLEVQFSGTARVLMSDPLTLREELTRSDLVIGAVLVPGARAPHLITREDLGVLRPGSVIADVAIDQGGCVETARPTTHADPTFVVDDVLHYCVANMPGAVPRTSTRALTNATLPYVLRLAGGVREALAADAGLAKGLNVDDGAVVNVAVDEAYAAYAGAAQS